MLHNDTTNQLGYTRMVTWIQSIIDALFAQMLDETAEPVGQREFAAERASHLFAQALHENSNLEIDWLWYAANMIGASERRYCLERALEINPHSGLARSALARQPEQGAAAGDSVALSRTAGAPW